MFEARDFRFYFVLFFFTKDFEVLSVEGMAQNIFFHLQLLGKKKRKERSQGVFF